MNFAREYNLAIGYGGASLRFSHTAEAQGLAINFEVIKQILGFPATMTLEIFNLSDTVRNSIVVGSPIQLQAGYSERGPLTIFTGEIVNVNHIRQNPDTITQLWCRDANAAYTGAVSSFSFGAGVPVSQVLNQAFTDLKKLFPALVKKDFTAITEKLTAPMASAGSTVEQLNKLANTYGFYWTIVDGKLVMFAKSSYVPVPVVEVNSATGMLGSPTVTETGADFDMQLNPELSPGGLVHITSAFSRVNLGDLLFRPINRTLGEGYFRAQKVTHKGSNRGSNWTSSVIGYRYERN
jgi:hypothetical protein